ncbi:non-homologous end-joining DNA ligase [Amycolatopsis thermophila]|uniref:Bifunctional non-homologous end joining protein LigD n=1 Tax=Amycolatopsis thermophila TaxID=206084 RepID=A0ABU0ESB2_9PSEU|nr:non-homologous end-joining DNA ligase [Amycolatopsis thermophila]MDQ0377886.1 bifunctional non-homologous end joining protein LigD [Amycolatopsis thermophila]
MNPDEIEVSRPGKVLYPDGPVTKGDVVSYYRRVADVMLPHLRGRPLTLRRFPDGIGKQGWFQKEASDFFPDWMRVEAVPTRDGGSVHHVICDDAATLVYLANQAVLEFHVWTSTVHDPGRPDLLVIDLDPPPGVGVAELRRVARRSRDVLGALGLSAFVQATGGRGFHVVAPLDCTSGHDEVLSFAREVADFLAAEDPARLTTQPRKDKRGDRIFLDVNRNGYAQTFVAPYSLRARPGAAVATPLDWAELGRVSPDGFDVRRVPRRLARKADPWRELGAHAGSARKALDRLHRLT